MNLMRIEIYLDAKIHWNNETGEKRKTCEIWNKMRIEITYIIKLQ